MPGVGVLICRNNLIGLKFNDSFTDSVQFVPQKLINTKKDVNLAVEVNTKEGPKGNSVLPNLAKTLQTFRPKTNMATRVSADGERWLKNALDIDLRSVDDEKSQKTFGAGVFLNDKKKTKIEHNESLAELKLDTNLLESLISYKSALLASMKKSDAKNLGSITKEVLMTVFKNAEIEGLTEHILEKILNFYCKTNPFDYTKFMGYLVRDVKALLKESESTGAMKRMSETARLGHFPSLSSSKIEKSSDEINKEKKKSLESVINEIRTIKSIFYKIKQQNYVKIDQKISRFEFVNVLRQYSIVYTSDKLGELLVYLELNPNAFSMREFEEHLNSCQINRLQSDRKRNKIRRHHTLFQ